MDVVNILRQLASVVDRSLAQHNPQLYSIDPAQDVFSISMMADCIHSIGSLIQPSKIKAFSQQQVTSIASHSVSATTNELIHPDIPIIINSLLKSVIQYYCICNGNLFNKDSLPDSQSTIIDAASMIPLLAFSNLFYGIRMVQLLLPQDLDEKEVTPLKWLKAFVIVCFKQAHPDTANMSFEDVDICHSNNIGLGMFGMQYFSDEFVPSIYAFYVLKLQQLVANYEALFSSEDHSDIVYHKSVNSQTFAYFVHCYTQLCQVYRYVVVSMYNRQSVLNIDTWGICEKCTEKLEILIDTYYKYYYSDSFPLSTYADKWYQCLHKIFSSATSGWECTACNPLFGLPATCVVTNIKLNKIIHIIVSPVDGLEHVSRMNRSILVGQQEYLLNAKKVETMCFPSLECCNITISELNALWTDYVELLIGSKELEVMAARVPWLDIVSMWTSFDPKQKYVVPSHAVAYPNKDLLDNELVQVRLEIYKLKERLLLLNQLRA